MTSYRSDGTEDVVDNKFMKTNNPLLVAVYLFLLLILSSS